MNDIKEIESLVLNNFSFLQDEFGSKSPILNRDKWNTTVSYIFGDVSIEIELDWRDIDVFVLVTKLDNGELPKGYYSYNGRICRVHLEKVLQDNLNVKKSEINFFIQSRNTRKRKRDKESMVDRIKFYQKLVQNFVSDILRFGESLFQK